MRIKRLLTGAVSCALCLSVLVGCGGGSSDTGNGVIVNLQQEPTTMNTVIATGTVDGNVMRHVLEGLVALDENDQAIPGVAKSWDISEDKMTYTFNLRKDSKWSNGDKVTANDFVFAFNQLFTQKNAAPYAETWAPLFVGATDVFAASKDGLDSDAAKEALKNAGWKAIDDNTLEIKTTAPYTYFVPLMAYMSFYPVNEKVWTEAGGVSGYALEANKMVYNGAFEISKWNHGEKIELAKRADYWDAKKIKLDSITMKMIADANASLNEYNAGSIDLITLSGDQPKQLKKEGKEILSYDDGSNFYINYNVTVPGLSNKKVRKAITLAIDAQKFITNILKNSSTVANQFTPKAINAGEFAKTVGDQLVRPETGLKEMPEVKALFEEGLKEEGLTVADLKFSLLADEGDNVTTQCAYVQEQLKTILGLDIQVEQVTYKARIARQQAHDFTMVFAGWGPDYNDPMTFLDLFVTGGGNNHGLWSNTAYDELIKKASTEGDVAVRTGYLVDAEKLLAEEMPVGYVYGRVRDYVTSDRLTGVRRTAFQDLNLKYAEVK